uniref:Putative ovule protein n=1 Tax=Solanum chacoense TaxID=4108 RepID=A0A0V0GNW5_SOLCH
MCVLIMATNRPVTLVSGIHSVVLFRWMRQFPLEACFKSNFKTFTTTGTFIPYCCNSMLASLFHVDLRNNHINIHENLNWNWNLTTNLD